MSENEKDKSELDGLQDEEIAVDEKKKDDDDSQDKQ